MGKLKIEGIGPPLEGEYDLDLEERPLDGWDAHLIKTISGLRVNELGEGIAAGDYDVVIALALIALYRNGIIKEDEVGSAQKILLKAELGKISLMDEEDMDSGDVLPPESEPVVPSDGISKSEFSGTSSSNDSADLSETIPISIGQQT
jgi:hypothetical protein